MRADLLDVSPRGAVLLGTDIVCDGFHHGFPARVQTHVHVDHMSGFETSKGFQDIFLTEPTFRLLVTELNAELGVRQNIHVVEVGNPREYGNSAITLLPSGHMLGSVQVAVEMTDGLRLGYSGDFQWPLDAVIQVDGLVVDSTYGGPDCRREYSQEEAEGRFLELVVAASRLAPVHIKAHRGTLQRALQILAGNVQCPIIGTQRFCAELDVYRQFGYAIGAVHSSESDEGRAAMAAVRFIRFYGKGDGLPVEIGVGTTVTLSAYMARRDDPIIEYSDRSFGVALSNHADFDGTIAYVRATGAKYVVTDNSRGAHAVELATEIRSCLGIDARPSSDRPSREWGV